VSIKVNDGLWDFASSIAKLFNVLLMEKSVVGLMERRLLPESASALFSKAIVAGNFDCAQSCVMLFGYFTHNKLFA
jgi:hypothetical protein